MKQFNVQSAIKWTTQCMTEKTFLDSISCCEYREVIMIVWYVEFSGKHKGTFQKCLRHALENVTNCLFVLPFLPPGCLWKRTLVKIFASFECACTTAPLRALIPSRYASLCCVLQL